MSDMFDTSQGNKESVAYHEAGHAVLWRVFGVPIEEVRIKKNGDGKWQGHVKVLIEPFSWSEESAGAQYRPMPKRKEQHIMIHLAGFAVGRIRRKKWMPPKRDKSGGIVREFEPDCPYGSDLEEVYNICWEHIFKNPYQAVYGSTKNLLWKQQKESLQQAYQDWMLLRTQWLLSTPIEWARVEAVANKLLEDDVDEKVLKGDEVHRIIDSVQRDNIRSASRGQI
jgi:hypothetical protein